MLNLNKVSNLSFVSNLLKLVPLRYGCRAREDRLFGEEVDLAVAASAITRCIVAWSRAPELGPKRYVQNAVAQETEALAPMFTDPRCHLYVCGESSMVRLRDLGKGGGAELRVVRRSCRIFHHICRICRIFHPSRARSIPPLSDKIKINRRCYAFLHLMHVQKTNDVCDVSLNNINERSLHRGGQHLGGGSDARARRGAGGERDARGGTGAHGCVWHRRGREARGEDGVGGKLYF